MTASSRDERIVRDPHTGMVMVRRGHNWVCGSADELLALAGLLIRAAYEAPRGAHDAPELPASNWTPPA